MYTIPVTIGTFEDHISTKSSVANNKSLHLSTIVVLSIQLKHSVVCWTHMLVHMSLLLLLFRLSLCSWKIAVAFSVSTRTIHIGVDFSWAAFQWEFCFQMMIYCPMTLLGIALRSQWCQKCIIEHDKLSDQVKFVRSPDAYTSWPEVHWVRTGGCSRLLVSFLLCIGFNWLYQDSVSTCLPFPVCLLSTVPSGQGLPEHPTEQRDAVQCQQPSGHRHVSCDAQSEPADLSGGQSSRQAPQLYGAAQGAGRHGHRLQSRLRGRPHHHLRYRGPGWTPHQLHHHSGTSIMCRSWFRYQHYVQVLIQVPALCAGLDSGTSIPALCAGLDSGTSIMCRTWSRYQNYVQVLIQVAALCAGLDPGISTMCRSWSRYQHYVQVLIQVPALCAGLDSGTSIMCSSEVPTHISLTESKHVLYWKRFTPNFRPWGLPFLRSCKEITVIPNGLNIHFNLHFYTSAKRKQYIYCENNIYIAGWKHELRLTSQGLL